MRTTHQHPSRHVNPGQIMLAKNTIRARMSANDIGVIDIDIDMVVVDGAIDCTMESD